MGNELYHYGVLGMKWGVRKHKMYMNPYISRRLKKNKDRKVEKKGISSKQKKAIKIGIAIVGTALAAYGAYKIGNKAIGKIGDTVAKYNNQQADYWIKMAQKETKDFWANNDAAKLSIDRFKAVYDPYIERNEKMRYMADMYRNAGRKSMRKFKPLKYLEG